MDQRTSTSIQEDLISLQNTIYPWSDLPPLVLEYVYLCLNRQDRVQMSLVCKNWSREYSSPELWRSMMFVLPEYYSPKEYPEVKFAQKYGHMLHHVEIVCKSAQNDLIGVIWMQLRLFLQAITSNSQLISISFVNMNKFLKCLEHLGTNSIFESIVNLFLSQRKLKSVKFINSKFGKYTASLLLTMISIVNAPSLKHLGLEVFVKQSIYTKSLNDMVMNLHEIVIDYTQIFEEIMWACFVNEDSTNVIHGKSALRNMKVLCDGSENFLYRGIPPAAWKCLSEMCPLLKIDLSFYAGYPTRNSIEVFVVECMPLKSLVFRGDREGAAPHQFDVGSLLRHLLSSRINVYLEELHVEWLESGDDFATESINFLHVSPRLKVLQLFFPHPVDSLETMFNHWLKNGTMAVELVHITVAQARTGQDSSHYVSLGNLYGPLLEALGLELILLID